MKIIRERNLDVLKARDRVHPVEHSHLRCVPNSLRAVDAPWHSVLNFLWQNRISTVACCGGHEGMTSEVFLGWEASGPQIDELLQMAFFLLLERDLKLQWEILCAFGRLGCGFCWILQVRCPDPKSGWSNEKLAKAKEDIQSFSEDLPKALLFVRDYKKFEQRYV